MAKHIFITGGVVSSLGKGINAASIGQILKSRGLKVFMQKFDPYINVDPGTMSPFQHGEVFVTNDGAETDLDLGHYERFIDENLSKESSVSTGKIYQAVIDKERKGLYNGATIQVIPHITDEIKLRLKEAAISSKADIIITEIGGTVGDIESLPYLEAIRQVRADYGFNKTLYIHNTLVPYLNAAKEIKTKPTQHSVRELKSLGIDPDILMLRSEVDIPNHAKDKIALFSGIRRDAIIESKDVDIIYEQIIKLREQKVDDLILDHFNITNTKEPNLSLWEGLVNKIKGLNRSLKIGIVGKYVTHHDAYLSLVEALKHSGYKHNVKIENIWINTKDLTDNNVKEKLSNLDGVIIQIGFGSSDTFGKVVAIKYARENKVPLLGICYGMQLALIEYAQNVLNIKDANSMEINEKTKNPIFIENDKLYIGSKEVNINKISKIYNIYNNELVNERFRNKYIFNDNYKNEFIKNEDVILSSYSNNILTSFELKDHPWFLTVQYHPEYLSRPLRPHPIFNNFIEYLANK